MPAVVGAAVRLMYDGALSAPARARQLEMCIRDRVYIGGQAERAIENFFRKGNLIALRELALRRTADRVDEQMRAWRDRQGQEKVWHTRDAILLLSLIHI